MEITENTFMDILGLPEWDDSVLEVLEVLELERPIVEEGEEYAYLSSGKYGIDLMFDYDCITPLQKKLEAERNLYLRQITFLQKAPFVLPFGLSMDDNYSTVIHKIGREPDMQSKGSDTSFRWNIEWVDKEIRFVCDFKDENLNSLKEFWMDY